MLAGDQQPTMSSSSTTPAGSGQSTASMEDPLLSVHVDASVLLQVARHCQDAAPGKARGQLMALVTDDRVEISNCFPFPAKKELDKDGTSLEAFVASASSMLRATDGDAQNVGWYETTTDDDSLLADLMQTVFSRSSCPVTLILGFDASNCQFRVLKPTQALLDAWDTGSHDVLSLLSAQDLFVELPILVKQPLLLDAFLLQWMDRDPHLKSLATTSNSFSGFDFNQLTVSIDRTARLMNTSMDDMSKSKRADFEKDDAGPVPMVMTNFNVHRCVRQTRMLTADSRLNLVVWKVAIERMAENGCCDVFQLERGFSRTRNEVPVDVTLQRNRDAPLRAAAARDAEAVAKRKLQEFTVDTQTAVIGSLKQRVSQLEGDLIGKDRELLQSESRREELAAERSLIAGHYVATAESRSAHAVTQLTVVRDENCALLAQFSDMERLLHVKDREIWSRDEEKHVLEGEVVELKQFNHSKDVDLLLLQDEVRTLQSQLSAERTRHEQAAREAASDFHSRVTHLEAVHQQSVNRSKAALDALQVELDYSRSIQAELREQISRQSRTIEAQLQSERALRLEVVQLQQSLVAADATAKVEALERAVAELTAERGALRSELAYLTHVRDEAERSAALNSLLSSRLSDFEATPFVQASAVQPPVARLRKAHPTDAIDRMLLAHHGVTLREADAPCAARSAVKVAPGVYEIEDQRVELLLSNGQLLMRLEGHLVPFVLTTKAANWVF